MPVRMPVRQTPVPAGDGRGQPEPGEKDPTSEATGVAKATQATRVRPATGRRPVWDGRDVSFPPLRPTASRPAQPGQDALPAQEVQAAGGVEVHHRHPPARAAQRPRQVQQQDTGPQAPAGAGDGQDLGGAAPAGTPGGGGCRQRLRR